MIWCVFQAVTCSYFCTNATLELRSVIRSLNLGLFSSFRRNEPVYVYFIYGCNPSSFLALVKLFSCNLCVLSIFPPPDLKFQYFTSNFTENDPYWERGIWKMFWPLIDMSIRFLIPPPCAKAIEKKGEKKNTLIIKVLSGKWQTPTPLLTIFFTPTINLGGWGPIILGRETLGINSRE